MNTATRAGDEVGGRGRPQGPPPTRLKPMHVRCKRCPNRVSGIIRNTVVGYPFPILVSSTRSPGIEGQGRTFSFFGAPSTPPPTCAARVQCHPRWRRRWWWRRRGRRRWRWGRAEPPYVVVGPRSAVFDTFSFKKKREREGEPSHHTWLSVLGPRSLIHFQSKKRERGREGGRAEPPRLRGCRRLGPRSLPSFLPEVKSHRGPRTADRGGVRALPKARRLHAGPRSLPPFLKPNLIADRGPRTGAVSVLYLKHAGCTSTRGRLLPP